MADASLILSLVNQRTAAIAAAASRGCNEEGDALLVVSVDLGDRPTISRHLFGLLLEHLGRCVYDGVWDCHVGTLRTSIVDALRELRTPNLRWPGGCFADGYHWRDGIGSREQRPKRVNQHWGGGLDNNAFGTAEFLDLCEQVGCEPYIVGNVGSGTVAEMRDYHEYLTYPAGSTLAEERRANGRDAPWAVRLWGVGNEPWGCGGDMDVRTYAAEYRRFACFLSAHGSAPPLVRVACGANGRDLAWTEGMMSLCTKRGGSGRVRFAMEALSVHLYCSVRTEGITGHEQGAAEQGACAPCGIIAGCCPLSPPHILSIGACIGSWTAFDRTTAPPHHSPDCHPDCHPHRIIQRVPGWLFSARLPTLTTRCVRTSRSWTATTRSGV